MRKRVTVLMSVYILLFPVCKSRDLTEEGISACLARTDFIGHNTELRAAVGWQIVYDRKVRETKCCALQPRSDVLTKRSDIKAFKAELLNRIDILETNSFAGAPTRTELRENNPCYAGLMDLYHDVVRAAEKRAR